jgi:hypothetical protein
MAALGRSTAVLARKLEIAFRRPSFAGETLRVAARLFEGDDGKSVVTGVFYGEGDLNDPARARVFARMSFEP